MSVQILGADTVVGGVLPDAQSAPTFPDEAQGGGVFVFTETFDGFETTESLFFTEPFTDF